MPGTANTNDFMLGTATVMIGLPADLYNLKPALHSIGLVKNFSVTSEPAYTELTQGVKGTLVDSILTSNPVRASMEVFEFTAKNLGWGLGLDASTKAAMTDVGVVDTASSGTDADLVLGTGEGAGFATDDYAVIEIDTNDHVLVRKVVSVATDTVTFDQDITEVVPVGASVKKVNQVAVGSKDNQPYLSANVVGRLSNGQAVSLLIPKMRISRGFTMAFSTDDYGNLPFEFTVYDVVAADTFYAEFLDSSGPVGARVFKV